MIKIRTEITKENLNFVNDNNISITKFINIVIETLRIEDASEENKHGIREFRDKILSLSKVKRY